VPEYSLKILAHWDYHVLDHAVTDTQKNVPEDPGIFFGLKGCDIIQGEQILSQFDK